MVLLNERFVNLEDTKESSEDDPYSSLGQEIVDRSRFRSFKLSPDWRMETLILIKNSVIESD